ncbi:MAG: NAD(P)-dependent dehydrogenase (short-subunit alcohol dehydrogenase family) [Gammaproteobacteria bacterium]
MSPKPALRVWKSIRKPIIKKDFAMPTVLITGASRGLGLEFARQYAADGWRVIATSRSGSPELHAMAAANDTVSLHGLDVADGASVSALSDAVGIQPIDVLLNNAGLFGRVAFADGGVEHQAFGSTDFDNWANVMNTNVFGPMRMAEMFADRVALSEQKKVVTLSSMLGSMALNTIGGLYAYRSSKAAVNQVMKSMSIDLAKRGILAIGMHPGWAKTEMGGPAAEIDAAEAVAGVRRQIAALDAAKLGDLLAYDGNVLPY